MEILKVIPKRIVVREELCPKNYPCPVIPRCPVRAVSQKTIHLAPVVDHSICKQCSLCVQMSGKYVCIGCGHE